MPSDNLPTASVDAPTDEQQSFGGIKPAWVLAFALIPCIASVAIAAISSKPPPLKVTASRPSLVFAAYLYLHGPDPVEFSPILETTFPFRNAGKVPVEIQSIDRSCGCMSPSVSPRIIQPGELGSVRVPIATINQKSGPQEFTLNVHYTDDKPREATLTIKAVFPEKMVTVTPPALFLSQKSEKSFPLPDVRIDDYRDGPLEVIDLYSTAPFINAHLERNSGAGIQQVSLDDATRISSTSIKGEVGGSIPPGRHHALIAVTTDDPSYPVVTIPMVVNGPSYLANETAVLSPAQFRMHASNHPDAVRRARLELLVPSSWTIDQAQSWPEVLSVRYQVARQLGSECLYYVDIELEELPPANLKHGIIQLSANGGKNLVTGKATFHWP